jgi:hypothetical protein
MLTAEEIRDKQLQAAARLFAWAKRERLQRVQMARLLTEIQPGLRPLKKAALQNWESLNGIPISRAWAVEILTGGEIRKHEIAPHIYPAGPGKLPDGVRRLRGLKEPRELIARL